MSKRVLIVDDSTFMRKRLRHTLSSQGAEIVGEAKDGNEAVSSYEKLRPDLVTMDITMRGKDGLTASQEILASHPDANIVIVTMLKEEDYENIARTLGVKGFVVKSDSSRFKAILDEI